LSCLPAKVEAAQQPIPKARNPRKTFYRNEPVGLQNELCRVFGVDLTQVPGINSLTAQALLMEIGPDLSRFPNTASFTSWLRLCPDKRVSGGKGLSSKTRPTKNRAALAFRMAAQSLHRSQTFPKDSPTRKASSSNKSSDFRTEGRRGCEPKRANWGSNSCRFRLLLKENPPPLHQVDGNVQ
jgi:Transposase IS116/IS110/IS902 family